MYAATAEARAAPATTALALGEIIDGRYRVEALLGGGGMASVYRATHLGLDQPVAIKVISPLLREQPGMAQRFLREARAATHLKSDHVVRVSDVGTTAGGAPYMVLEYLEGCDLQSILERGDEIPVEQAVDFMLQACEALAEVHGIGIVHRDLKPANLFLTRGADGLAHVKLIDFGISRTDYGHAARDLDSLTQPETVLGSPRYMSPEQMESASRADSRSDIYGVGAVLYELLTHKAPHDGETFLDLYAAATLTPPTPPSSLRADVPKALDRIILKCLAVNPEDRYAETAELAAALAPFGPVRSVARAEAAARILGAARERTQSAHEHEAAPSRSEADRSSVHSRSSSSKREPRNKPKTRAAALFVALAMGGLTLGGRELYTRSQADSVTTAEPGTATTTSTTATTAAPANMTAPPLENAPALATATATATATRARDTTTTETTSSRVTEPSMVTRDRPREKEAASAARTADPSQPPAATTAFAAAPPPAPASSPSHEATAAPPPGDEQALFEDRK